MHEMEWGKILDDRRELLFIGAGNPPKSYELCKIATQRAVMPPSAVKIRFDAYL